MTTDLWDVRDKYENLGVELGLLEPDIRAIQKTEIKDVDSCFNKVIGKCIAKGIYQRDIIKALSSSKVVEDALANKLRTKYGVSI